MEDAYVLVMASDVDETRLRVLVEHLVKDNVPVLLGPPIPGYPSYAQMHDAVVLLVAVAADGVQTPLPYPISAFAANAQAAVAILIEATGHSVAPTLPEFHLEDWPDTPTVEYERLVHHLGSLIESGLTFTPHSTRIDDANTTAARNAVHDLQSLTGVVGRLGGVLSEDNQQSQAIRDTLAEIGSTYKVVKTAIAQFTTAGQ